MTRNDFGSRHEGNLGGRLTDTRVPARVTIQLARDVAENTSAQHLVWMLVNLLARQPREITALRLMVPSGVQAVERLTPLARGESDLLTTLRAGMAAVNPALLGDTGAARTDVHIRVGSGPLGTADLNLFTTAVGWSGYTGREPVRDLGQDGNPIGAYVAACLTVGEVFKFIRAAAPDAADFPHAVWLDAFGFAVRDHAVPGPALPSELRAPDTVLAGVGAVANAFLHVLYALPDVRATIEMLDGDEAGIEDTNLNRYSLFGLSHLGRMKATAAAALFAGTGVRAVPADTHFQAWYATQDGRKLDLIVSAVDKNKARHALQDALPRLILGASTLEMRAQVNLYAPLEGGPCLRCRNPAEQEVADADVIQHLRTLSAEQRGDLARAERLEPDVLDAFLADPAKHCGKVSGETLRRFASASDEPEWSVGFVSVLAGVLLAAEYLKHGLNTPTLTACDNRFLFQFWRPKEVRANRVTGLGPEQGCLCNAPYYKRAMERLHGHVDHERQHSGAVGSAS